MFTELEDLIDTSKPFHNIGPATEKAHCKSVQLNNINDKTK